MHSVSRITNPINIQLAINQLYSPIKANKIKTCKLMKKIHHKIIEK